MPNLARVVWQAAAIPMQNEQVCLVTSRSGKRWVIPKGCIDRGHTPLEAALQEAWEEAGLEGELQPDPLGSFLYDKDGRTHHVVVYLLNVKKVHKDWPEVDFRERIWVTPAQAIIRIDEPGLREILRRFLNLQCDD